MLQWEQKVFCSLLKHNWAVQPTNCCSKVLRGNFNVTLIYLTTHWWFSVDLISWWHVLAKRSQMTCSWSPKQPAMKLSSTKCQSRPVYTSALSVRLNPTTKLILQQYCHTLAFLNLTLLQPLVRQSMWFCEANWANTGPPCWHKEEAQLPPPHPGLSCWSLHLTS